MEDYYDDWRNEPISFQSNLNKYEPEFAKGTRVALGLDTSRTQFEYEMNILEDNRQSGAIKEKCHWCKSHNTEWGESIWTCQDCDKTWDPMKLRFRGI